MKRLLFLFVFVTFCFSSQGQVQKLGDVTFPNTPGLYLQEPEDFRYFVDGQYHICSYLGLGVKYCSVLDTATEISTNSAFIPNRKYDFGTEKLYIGSRLTSNDFFDFPVYAYLDADGQFTQIPNLPSPPKAVRNGKGYTVTNEKLFEIALSPFEVNVLYTFETPIDGASTELYLSGDTILMAHKDGYSAFSLTDTAWTEPFHTYFDTYELLRIPQTGIQGRYLYAEVGTTNTIHEIGGQSTARIIPVIEGIPDFAFGNAFQSGLTYTEEQGRNVTNAQDRTWINLLCRIGESWDWQDHLVEIDRSASNPGLTVLRSFQRAKSSGFRESALTSLSGGERIVALGLFGEEGFEPYGKSNDEFSVLKDLLPGRAGSADYLVEGSSIILNNPSLFGDAYDKFWFSASTPGFGREICVSDGSPEGTHVVADLQPGLKGLRRVRFAEDNGFLYAFVQFHNYSTAVYHIGAEIPSPPTPEENEVEWEAFTSPIPEVAYLFESFDTTSEPQIKMATDGYLYQLLVGLGPGKAITDSLKTGQYNFGSAIPGPSKVLRLDKIDPATGHRIWRKLCLTSQGTNESSIKMLPSAQGKVHVMSIGPGSYADFENNISPSAAEYWENRNAANITTFSDGGSFENMVRIDFSEQLSDLLHFSLADDGHFIAVVALNGAQRMLRLLKFDKDGNVLSSSNPIISYRDEVRCWRDDNGLLWVSAHPKDTDCENCQAELRAYTESFALAEEFRFRYSGSIEHPNIHVLDNGERWYTGAFDGRLVFEFGSEKHTLKASNPGNLQPFVIRELAAHNFFLDAVLIDENVLGLTPSFEREGNVFLSYFIDGQLDVPPSSENIYGTRQVPRVHQLNHLVLQLDGAGFPNDAQSKTIYTTDNFRDIAFIDGLLENGLWWQSVIGKQRPLHTEWLGPDPEFIQTYHTRVQIAALPWPFTPADIPILPAMPDENESYMHIFPNPVSTGSFYIIPNDGNQIPYKRFFIRDMQGRPVYESSLNDFFNAQRIRLPQHLNAGVYHVIFSGEQARESHRLVLIR